ncbi:hypothetical protein JAAARDRAFT_48380 [Jaapia argillacea MUCL 33604]|uniref:Protein kinase domain-containing protein n=1 Tax=Jaapia argillacea MUCL 33604 TaxID=933084 RepID=A0A067PQ76_9AGAM|nr:hypothetical protein JAAARDRAFT_48380 [Jaapia argillacea MUCL 33604]
MASPTNKNVVAHLLQDSEWEGINIGWNTQRYTPNFAVRGGDTLNLHGILVRPMLSIPSWTAPTKPSPNEVLLVGTAIRDAQEGMCYGLYCHRQLLIISSQIDVPSQSEVIEDNNVRESVQLYHLQIIQTLLNTIEFGRSNWACLVRNGDGSGHRLLYKDKPTPSLSSSFWAPAVEENEIEYTRWVAHGQRHGIWRGREVDILITTEDPTWHRYVEWAVNGTRALANLGYSFEVLGLIVRNGCMVGIMTAAAIGRQVQYADRAAVYEAVARMQNHGVIHRGLKNLSILITDKGVRFTNPSAVLVIPKDDLQYIQEEGSYWHWPRLEIMFEPLKYGPNSGFNYRSESYTPCNFYLPRLPSLPRDIFWQLVSLICPSRQDSERRRKSHEAKSHSSKPSNRRHPITIDLQLDDEPIDLTVRRAEPLQDRPWNANEAIPAHVRATTAYHPYKRPQLKQKMLLAPD